MDLPIAHGGSASLQCQQDVDMRPWPGITGLAQVHGRNLISWEKKFEYDVWYVDNWSIGLDIKTLDDSQASPFSQGINEAGQATVKGLWEAMINAKWTIYSLATIYPTRGRCRCRCTRQPR